MIDGKHFDKSTVARLDTVFIRFTVTTVVVIGTSNIGTIQTRAYVRAYVYVSLVCFLMSKYLLLSRQVFFFFLQVTVAGVEVYVHL